MGRKEAPNRSIVQLLPFEPQKFAQLTRASDSTWSGRQQSSSWLIFALFSALEK
jgi:hypothetical protein